MKNDKEMIENSILWPGDTLCLKKRDKGFYSAFGVITTTSRPPLTIYLRGPRDFEQTKTYDTVDAMLADGWIVD